MNRALVLEAPADRPDGAGGRVRGWQTLGTLWGDVQAGQTRVVDGVAVATLKITVRAAPFGAPSRPVAGQRFREGARVFRITGVADGERVLICTAEEVS